MSDWEEFNAETRKTPWCSVPLYYRHMLDAVAYGDAQVGFKVFKYPDFGAEIPDVWFQWLRPPEKRKFTYPEYTGTPKDKELDDMPHKVSQKENWDSPDHP